MTRNVVSDFLSNLIKNVCKKPFIVALPNNVANLKRNIVSVPKSLDFSYCVVDNFATCTINMSNSTVFNFNYPYLLNYNLQPL